MAHLSYADKAETHHPSFLLGKQLSGPMHFKPLTSHVQVDFCHFIQQLESY